MTEKKKIVTRLLEACLAHNNFKFENITYTQLIAHAENHVHANQQFPSDIKRASTYIDF